MISCLFSSNRHRLIAGILVAVYALALPGVAQTGALIAAVVFAEHEAQLVAGDDHVDVVLHHHHLDNDSGAEAPHHHDQSEGWSMNGDDDDHHDHVCHFKTLDASSKPVESLVPTLITSAASSVQSFQFRVPGAPMVCHGSGLCARSPPLAPIQVLCLRTTVLVV